jgi:hypothetical protein
LMAPAAAVVVGAVRVAMAAPTEAVMAVVAV